MCDDTFDYDAVPVPLRVLVRQHNKMRQGAEFQRERIRSLSGEIEQASASLEDNERACLECCVAIEKLGYDTWSNHSTGMIERSQEKCH